MIQVTTLRSAARSLAKLSAEDRRTAFQLAGDIAGDGRKRRRKNGRRKAATVARRSKPGPRPKAPARPTPPPKAAAPRVRPRAIPDIEEDE